MRSVHNTLIAIIIMLFIGLIIQSDIKHNAEIHEMETKIKQLPLKCQREFDK